MKVLAAPFFRAVFLVTCAVFIRFWGDIFSNQPWGEEATDFFIDAVWRQVTPFTPVASTLFFAERIITSLGVLISVTKAPMIVHLFCSFIYIGICSYLGSRSFRWLIPSDNLRVFLCLLIALAPGSPEVIANLPCLPYVIGWGLALSLCAQDQLSQRTTPPIGQEFGADRLHLCLQGASEVDRFPQLRCLAGDLWYHRNFCFIWLLGVASSHISAVLAPLSALRWWRTRQSKYLWSLLCSLCCLVLHIVLAQYSRLEITTPVFNPLPLTATVLVGNIFSTSVLSVLTGFPSITLWEMSRPLVYFSCILIVLVALWSIFRSTDKDSSTVSLGLVLSVIFMFCVHAIARGNYLKDEIGYPAFHLSVRHFWLPYCCSLLVLISHCVYRFKIVNLRFCLIGVAASALLSVVWSWELTKQQHMEDWALFYEHITQGREYVNLGIAESLDQQLLPNVRLYMARRGADLMVGIERYQGTQWKYQPMNRESFGDSADSTADGD